MSLHVHPCSDAALPNAIPGDVKHSMADISKIESLLEYKPQVRFKEGLKKVYEWYRNVYRQEEE